MKRLNAITWVLLLVTLTASTSHAQTRAEKKAAQQAKVQELVSNQQYVFLARTVNPTGGRTRQVTNDYYTITILKDTIRCDLPYFGRAFSAPIGTAGGGINFTSSHFVYKAEPTKKGGWQISIEPKDVSDTRQVSININSSGTANATVISNNRQTISYTGTIVDIRK